MQIAPALAGDQRGAGVNSMRTQALPVTACQKRMAVRLKVRPSSVAVFVKLKACEALILARRCSRLPEVQGAVRQSVELAGADDGRLKGLRGAEAKSILNDHFGLWTPNMLRGALQFL